MYLKTSNTFGQAPTAYLYDNSISEVKADVALEIGQLLWKIGPAGVKVAIYDPNVPEQKRVAIDWAKREDSIGVKANRIEAAELRFGKAFADSGNISSQLTKLGSALKAAIQSAPIPQKIIPLMGTGPSLIRTLALFTHGTNTWIGIGGGISNKNAATVIKRIAPVLTVDAKIIIYGCSAARGQREKKFNWLINTMEPGGEDSVAAKIRDALIEEGKLMSSVWSHTEDGHTSRNPSLRYFTAGNGKGTKGHSYAGESIFGSIGKILALTEIESTVSALGYAINDDKQENFRKFAYIELRRLMYQAYVGAVIKLINGNRITNFTYRGVNLPEMAPLYPIEVADIVRRYWSEVYWSKERKEATAKKLIKAVGLRK